MKLRVVVDVDVSKTIAETIKRNGLTVCRDGSSMQVRVPNTPAIPRRKTKVEFVSDPKADISEVVQASQGE
jgi:hypothetical protein